MGDRIRGGVNVKVNGEEGFGIGDCGLAAEHPSLAHSISPPALREFRLREKNWGFGEMRKAVLLGKRIWKIKGGRRWENSVRKILAFGEAKSIGDNY